MKKVLLIWAMLCCPHVFLSAQMTLTKECDKLTAASGETFTYTLKYNCASTTGHCDNMIVKDVLPPEVEFVSAFGSIHTTSAVENSGTVTFTFQSTVNAGSTGDLLINVRFPNGTTPNGTDAINDATIEDDNTTPITSNSVTTTSTASCDWTVEKSIQGGGTPVIGEDITYEIEFCEDGGDGSLNLTSSTLVDELPVGVTFVSASNGGTYNSTNHEVTWNTGAFTYGNCYTRTVTVNFSSGTFSDGDPVTNIATLTGACVGEASGTLDDSTLNHNVADPVVDITVSKGVDGTSRVIGEIITYSINAENKGDIDVTNFEVIDTIPEQIDLLSVSTGRYNNTPHAITLNYQTNLNSTWTAWSGGPFTGNSNTELLVGDLSLAVGEYITVLQWDFGNMPSNTNASSSIELKGTLINPDNEGNPVNVGDSFTNTAYVSYEHNSVTTTIDDDATVTIDTPDPAEVLLYKGARYSERVIGQTFDYYVHPQNPGGIPLDNFVMTDTLPAAMELTSTESGGWSNAPFTNVTVRYQTNITAVWTDWTGSPFDGSTDEQLPVSALGLGVGEYVTMVHWDFGTVPPGFDSDGNRPRVYGTLLATDHDGNAVNIGDVIENCAHLSGENGGTTYTDYTCATTTVEYAKPRLGPYKSVETSSPHYPGDTITFRIRIKNDVNATEVATNPTVMDLLPEGMEYVPSSWVIYQNTAGAPSPNFYFETNYNSTGRTLLRWDWTGAAAFDFVANAQMFIDFKVAISAGVTAGDIENVFYMVSENDYDCNEDSETDVNDLDGDGDTTDIICFDYTEATVTIPSLAALESEKLVKGELDTEYSKYPASGLTTPGGLADYQLFVRNVGTVPMKDIVVIDILPFIGDKGVIDLSDRDSEWRPNLVGPVTAPAGITVYYSSEGNPCRDELTLGVPVGCSAPNWTTSPPLDITTVQSIKFDFGNIVMSPGDELMLEWPMRAPVNAPDNGEIAWNSFGFVATRTDNNSTLLAAEPIKVGIEIDPVDPAVYGDFVWIDTNQNGLQDGGETGLDNVRVELYRDNGDGVADPTTDELVSFTLTADGGLYLFPSLDADDYFAVFHIPPTYNLSTFQNTSEAGYTTSNDSDGQAATIGAFDVAITPITTLEVLEDDRTWDIGLYQDSPAKAALGNYVWFDRNANGLQDESITDGINGIEVRLYESGGLAPIATTTTANDLSGNPGYYIFDDLDADTDYFVEFVLTAYGGGLPNPSFTTSEQGAGGSDGNDSDAVVTADPLIARTADIDLNSGDYDDAWDAGIIIPVGTLSLGNRVWEDTNNNGVYDYLTGEQGVNGVKVNLYVDSDGSGDFSTGDTFYATTTTVTIGGVQGYYIFENLLAGDYIVEIDASNFGVSNPLDGMISSTGNDLGDNTAPDPDNDTNHDDNGYATSGGSIASKTVSLSDDSGSDPNEDGDGDGTTNMTVDFGLFTFSCPEITSLTSSPVDVCLGSTDVTLTITHEADPGDLALYYSTSGSLTAADLYSVGHGGATVIADPISPVAAATSTTQVFTVPNTAGTYYVYAILGNGNVNILDPYCLPMAIRSIIVFDAPEAGSDNNGLSVCNNVSGGSTTIDLDDFLSGADLGGAWAETTGSPSGSFNTSTAVFDGEGLTDGNSYTFTYTVTNGSAPAGCNQDVATFTVTVNYCCLPGKCGRVNVTRN